MRIRFDQYREDRGGTPPDAVAFTPAALTVTADHVQTGDEHVSCFAVIGYPRRVYPGWLHPLITYPARVDISVHIEPSDPITAQRHLKTQLAKLESGRRHTAEHGRLTDPHVETATDDAYDLADQIARGEGKLFRIGLYLAVHARSDIDLAEDAAAVRAVAASLLLDAVPVTYRSLPGWITTLPMGLDLIGLRRTFDTAALSALFPFASPDIAPPSTLTSHDSSGVLYGENLGSQGLVFWDRFALDNHNSVVLGRSGAGKSYLVKLEALRSLHQGVHVHVVDPEDEYIRLANAVGGTALRLGAPGVFINPLDVPVYTRPDGRRITETDALVRRSLFLHTVITMLLGVDLTMQQRTVLDKAITATYQHAGITADPRTWTRPAPLLRDLRNTLAGLGNTIASELADHLHPYTEGAFASLFTGPTTTVPEGHLVVFSLRQLPEELKPIGTMLALDTIWRTVSNPTLRRKRLVIVDEAWLLMKDKAGAEFLYRMAKSGRKHWTGLTVATQDTADLAGSDLGRAVITNAATQILLRQAPQAIDIIADTFALSDGERRFLLSAEQGHGLLVAGTQRAAFHALASPAEHDLITTDPKFLATLQESDANSEWVEL